MNINLSDLVKSVTNEVKHSDIIDTFIKELEEGIRRMNDNNIEEFTIDRFEGNIAVCENRQTKEMINVKAEELPEGAREGNILIRKEGKFVLNQRKEQEISERIKEKMDNLWNN